MRTNWFTWDRMMSLLHFCSLVSVKVTFVVLSGKNVFLFSEFKNHCSLLKVHKIVLYVNWFKVCSLSLDENIKKRSKFLLFFFTLVPEGFLNFSLHEMREPEPQSDECESRLLRLSFSDKIDIVNKNWWKSIKIELSLPKLIKPIKIDNHKNFCYRLLSIFDVKQLISIEKYPLQSILWSIEIIDW